MDHALLSQVNGNKALGGKVGTSPFSASYSAFVNVRSVLMMETCQSPLLHKGLGEAGQSFHFSEVCSCNIKIKE